MSIQPYHTITPNQYIITPHHTTPHTTHHHPTPHHTTSPSHMSIQPYHALSHNTTPHHTPSPNTTSHHLHNTPHHTNTPLLHTTIHHHHQTRDLGGRGGDMKDDAVVSLLHPSRSSALRSSAESFILVHSLMLSIHDLFCLPLLLPPSSVPCSTVFGSVVAGDVAEPCQLFLLDDGEKGFLWTCQPCYLTLDKFLGLSFSPGYAQ